MSYDFTGRLYKIFDLEQVKETFKKREFVVEQVDGQYPNHVKFELTQDRCGLIDPFNEGDEVTVSFDLSGRQWNDKFFTNLRAWRVQGAGAADNSGRSSSGYENQAAPPANSNSGASKFAETESSFSSGASNDDLPF